MNMKAKKWISGVLAAGVMALVPCGAFAAEVTVNTTQNDGVVTVAGNVTNASAGQQVTVLVVKKNTVLADLTTADVAYIDQVGAAESYSFSFAMPDNMQTGSYDVYVGGTDVETLGTDSFTPSSPAGNYTLSGTISASASNNRLAKIKVTAYEAGTDKEVATTNLNADGTYELALQAGTYDIKVSRTSYLTKTYEGVVISADDSTTVNGLTLIAGDVSADNYITSSDLAAVKTYFGLTTEEALEIADLSEDDYVTSSDASVIRQNLGQTY